ncbi:unnamed protein product [Protopolystoma xenopodis]|uniref:Uncharacterized protein n=1 Tax=Protopolystoma xenopodis TaxID=117903 RepID=A0A3S5CIF1_9PLAT|nr:unnamed protein product [Protopolystoma xenopodis]
MRCHLESLAGYRVRFFPGLCGRRQHTWPIRLGCVCVYSMTCRCRLCYRWTPLFPTPSSMAVNQHALLSVNILPPSARSTEAKICSLLVCTYRQCCLTKSRSVGGLHVVPTHLFV